MYLYLADVCGDVAAGLWHATARAAASGIKLPKTSLKQRKERPMTTTNGHKGKDRIETATTNRFAEKAHETVDALAERAQRTEREVRGAAARTAEQARELQEEYSEKAEQSLKRATSYFESNPLAFAGIAFVAGVLFSTMLRR
jgi:ElaB/YqjD/DUF883 family membrane-anchored ribosome-binding protein